MDLRWISDALEEQKRCPIIIIPQLSYSSALILTSHYITILGVGLGVARRCSAFLGVSRRFSALLACLAAACRSRCRKPLQCPALATTTSSHPQQTHGRKAQGKQSPPITLGGGGGGGEAEGLG